ncbi:MAG: M23 family metallopeptidase [Thermodesulfobacteriota bacterium]|nr:M23 family metallopeptidase [Thermodesulfobacteriota bacterium]
MLKSRFPITVFGLLIFFLILAVAALKFEFFKPEVRIAPDVNRVGTEKTITITAKDRLSGLREIEVTLLQGGKKVEMARQSFPRGGLLLRGNVKRHSTPVTLRPLGAGLVNGEAVLRVSVRDYSWWGWFSGNRRIIDKKVSIDSRPPDVYALSTAHNINLGGSGLVVYQAENDVPVSGVYVGRKFYRGYPKPEGPKGVYVAYFALPWDAPADVPLYLAARDEAGNTARVPFTYRIKTRRFRADNIALSPAFLQTKMPELMQHYPDLKGSHEEVFVQVNHKIRVENDRKVAEICSRSEAGPLWTGAFLRMQNAAPMGLFADQRIYTYNGQEIDRAVHLGIDLASNERAPIQAANTGKIIFTGYLGIYGNTVIMDHGQGIFSLYAHLSSINVAPGQMVEKGMVLGCSGSTGLAGGDHLHFSMLVGGTFVNPVEWWDEHWIQDNVTLKLSN